MALHRLAETKTNPSGGSPRWYICAPLPQWLRERRFVLAALVARPGGIPATRPCLPGALQYATDTVREKSLAAQQQLSPPVQGASRTPERRTTTKTSPS